MRPARVAWSTRTSTHGYAGSSCCARSPPRWSSGCRSRWSPCRCRLDGTDQPGLSAVAVAGPGGPAARPPGGPGATPARWPPAHQPPASCQGYRGALTPRPGCGSAVGDDRRAGCCLGRPPGAADRPLRATDGTPGRRRSTRPRRRPAWGGDRTVSRVPAIASHSRRPCGSRWSSSGGRVAGSSRGPAWRRSPLRRRIGGHHWRTPAERYVTLTIDWATVPLVAGPLPAAAGLTTR